MDLKRKTNKLYLVNNSHVKLSHMPFKSTRIRTTNSFGIFEWCEERIGKSVLIYAIIYIIKYTLHLYRSFYLLFL